jgi:hypothetical protein
MNKIVVCDVYTLKHLFKITTGDEEAIFDSFIEKNEADQSEVFKVAHIGEDKK